VPPLIAEEKYMIETEGLTKIYEKARILANDNISLRIGKGKVFALLGPNGAGKTTLIKILSTLVLPTSGTAKVNGYDILKHGSKVRRSIGLSTGRERSFYFRLTGTQNLEFFGALREVKGRESKSRIEHLMRVLGLWEHKDRKYMKYSTGMKKKLSLARAMLTDPPIYLLDEPTSGIDPASARDIREMITGLKDREKTILVATHDMHEAEELSDEIGILNEGKLIKKDTPGNLRNLFQAAAIIVKPARRLSLEDVAGLRRLPSVKGVIAQDGTIRVDSREPHAILDEVIKVVRAQAPLTDVKIVKPSLEEVFIRLTEGGKGA
jgi:ABC-2 type transport system ATP-binding protein